MTIHDLCLLPADNFAPDEDDLLTPTEEAIAADWAELIATAPPEAEFDFDAYEHDAPLCVLLAA